MKNATRDVYVWVDYLRDRRHRRSPLINAVPVIILAITAPSTDRRRAG